jgi:A/G-specific adenine glycosylase
VGEVRHTFTHFHLILTVLTARVEGPVTRGDWTPRAAFRPADLPTVMRKAWHLAAPGLLRQPPEAMTL